MNKTKFNRIIKFSIRFSLTWILLYLAFIEEIAGASNVVHALAWIGIVISPLMLAGSSIKELKKHPKDFIFTIDKMDDLVIVGVFIWFGSVATGIAWLIALAISLVAMDMAKNEKE